MNKIIYKKPDGSLAEITPYGDTNSAIKDVPEGAEHWTVDDSTYEGKLFDALIHDGESFVYDENKVKKILKELIKSVIKDQIKTALNNNDDYDDIYDLCLDGPEDSTEETAERLAGKTYRKAVKDYRKQLLEDIKDGIITAITEADIINGMPVIVWPL